MIRVLDKDGQEIEIRVGGDHDDDIQIESAEYLKHDDVVSDETIDYIMYKYASELYDEWYQNKIMAADNYYEGDR